MTLQGILYVVATPIGNLADITLRALDTLKMVDVIAAEDTRHSAGLLKHYGISKKLIAVHQHNEQKSAYTLLARLQAGENVALITDAGTPAVSDPGALVVSALRVAGIKIVPIPGVSAVIAALSVSGLPQPRFLFVGFLPSQATQRRKHIESLKTIEATLVFYEAPHRIIACVQDLCAILGEGYSITFARELTKTYETIYTCPLSEAEAWLNVDLNQQKGEFVLLVTSVAIKANDTMPDQALRTLKLLLKVLPLKQAVALTSEITGQKKNTLYDIALQMKTNTSKPL